MCNRLSMVGLRTGLFLSAEIPGFCPFRGRKLQIGGTAVTNEQRMIVSALRAQGMGYGAIARKVGISENTVKSFCRRNAQKEDKPVTGAGEHRCCAVGRRSPSKLAGKKRSSALTSAETSGGMPISIKLTAGRSGRSSVQTAAGPFRFTGAPRESTASHACYIQHRFGGGGGE